MSFSFTNICRASQKSAAPPYASCDLAPTSSVVTVCCRESRSWDHLSTCFATSNRHPMLLVKSPGTPAIFGENPPERTTSQASEGLGQEALPLLWRAQRCGLAAEHWVVEALRGYAAEVRGKGGATQKWGASLGTGGKIRLRILGKILRWQFFDVF